MIDVSIASYDISRTHRYRYTAVATLLTDLLRYVFAPRVAAAEVDPVPGEL